MREVKALEWTGDTLLVLDQRKLPGKVEFIECRDYLQVAGAIKDMLVRGAPAIGVAAAFGMALGAMSFQGREFSEFMRHMAQVGDILKTTRPTAVNLFWAIERMMTAAAQRQALDEVICVMVEEAQAMMAEDIEANKRIGRFGASLVDDGDTILTHCNAGALATAGYGTALGVIRRAHSEGKRIKVYAGETRPYLQGSRLTSWELLHEGIPVTVIADGAAGYLMSKGMVDKVIVGADRIARNGDVANKVGTYGLAVLAKENGIPFYVAAPTSTVDLTLGSGDEIPIEERDPKEITHFSGLLVAPEGVSAFNPAFDITPGHLVTAIITERGVAKSPFEHSLKDI